MAQDLRTYRKKFRQEDLIHFQVVVKETDLDIGIRKERFSPKLAKWILKVTRECRLQLEKYIQQDPQFLTALTPYQLLDGAPQIALEMAWAAQKAKVGPMAAVAGAIAEYVGKTLLRYSKDVIIENGGDIFLRTTRKRNIGIFAGDSPFSNRLALEIQSEDTPLGICTSSGTVGHSLSFGKADAVVVLSPSTALADAVATAVANIILSPEDLKKAVELAGGITGISGLVAIKEDKLVAWGKVKLKPLA